MALSLNTIKPALGSSRKKKRVGRGNASGHGTYSTRGIKGQKSRTGVSNLKRLGLKKILLSTPKSRGFKSLKAKAQVVNILELNKIFKEGDKITPIALFKKGMIKDAKSPVKVLGKGELKVKLNFEGIKLSENVKSQIEKKGGEIK